MMAASPPISPHLPPPAHIKAAHKALQHSSGLRPSSCPASARHLSANPLFVVHSVLPASTLAAAFRAFSPSIPLPALEDAPVYSPRSHPGLYIIPSLFPPSIQLSLLSSLLITQLSDTATNRTNLHLHFDFPEPPFTLLTAPDSVQLQPRDPSVHKPMTARRARERKLRWMTLGGQYDWTKKRYPRAGDDSSSPGDTSTDVPNQDLEAAEKAATPPFPPDLSSLIHKLWPEIEPQAAIVNVYSPGDTLAPHRDVAESSGAGLVSISIGCDAVFMIARSDSSSCEAGDSEGAGEKSGVDGTNEAVVDEDGILSLILHSGDMVVMSASMRRAWHSVPKIIAGTCPSEIAAWPGSEEEDVATKVDGGEVAKGWMAGKRVNFNVRQMWDRR